MCTESRCSRKTSSTLTILYDVYPILLQTYIQTSNKTIADIITKLNNIDAKISNENVALTSLFWNKPAIIFCISWNRINSGPFFKATAHEQQPEMLICSSFDVLHNFPAFLLL